MEFTVTEYQLRALHDDGIVKLPSGLNDGDPYRPAQAPDLRA